ncbi:MAG: Ig-like domain-containing protein [Bacillota bacterium]|nr:Ig-like domain-containing protein [Bacillota bacterium]
MNKKIFYRFISFLALLLFFTFLPQLMTTPSSIAQASETEKEKNNEYRLKLNNITLVTGKSYTLVVYNVEKDASVSFRSADPSIASVNSQGTITGNKVGKTTVTATVRRGLSTSSLTCNITVGPPAFSIRATRSMIILEVGQNAVLDVIMKPGNTTELAKFSSRNDTIAYISPLGRISAMKPGMTYVFAQIDATNPYGREKFTSCSVIVCNTDEAEQLNNYFEERYELRLIPQAQLTSVLYEFFNSKEETPDETSKTENTTLANSSTSTEATQDSTTSLIDSLDAYLNSIYDLEDLRQRYEEIFKLN